MIRVAINGYGNLGRGVEQAVSKTTDMETVVVFTRRDPEGVDTLGAPAARLDDAADWVGKVDVCINCGGSATDLGEQTPAATALFHTVDSWTNSTLTDLRRISCGTGRTSMTTSAALRDRKSVV